MSWRLPCDVCGEKDEVFNRQSLLCTGCLYTGGGAYWDSLSLEEQTNLLLKIHEKETLKDVAIKLICHDLPGEEPRFCEKCQKDTPHWIMFGVECIPCDHELEIKTLMARPPQQIVDILFDKSSKDPMALYIKVGIAPLEVIQKYNMMPTPDYVELYKETGIYDHLNIS